MYAQTWVDGLGVCNGLEDVNKRRQPGRQEVCWFVDLVIVLCGAPLDSWWP